MVVLPAVGDYGFGNKFATDGQTIRWRRWDGGECLQQWGVTTIRGDREGRGGEGRGGREEEMELICLAQ